MSGYNSTSTVEYNILSRGVSFAIIRLAGRKRIEFAYVLYLPYSFGDETIAFECAKSTYPSIAATRAAVRERLAGLQTQPGYPYGELIGLE